MPYKILRGRLLDFLREPEGPDDFAAFRYEEDGAILIEDGIIRARGTFDAIWALAGKLENISQDMTNVLAEHIGQKRTPQSNASGEEVVLIDHRPNLIMPGFIDTHMHFPQMQVMASWGADLIGWLQNYTFPQEALYADSAHSARMASLFCDELIRNGTTSAVVYGSSHPSSVEAFFAEGARRNMRVIAGKVMMDRNAPANVCDDVTSSYDDSKALIETWHGKGRAHYAITPRFAITSTPEQLEAAGALAKEFPDCYIQTHMDENIEEIKWTSSLFPLAWDYAQVYEKYGLLSAKTLLGHCIHLKVREVDCLAETGAHPIFCPTSNLFLGSGLFDYPALSARRIPCGIASDIGGGTSFSMLTTLAEGYKVLALKGFKLHPIIAFYWASLGNAKCLGLEDRIGTLEPGSEADIIVLNSRAVPAMALRMEACENLVEELFILQIMGDDRAVDASYIAGQRAALSH